MLELKEKKYDYDKLLAQNNKVFVYGTLRRAYGNGEWFENLGGSYVSEDTTADIFILYGNQFPFAVTQNENTHQYSDYFKPVLGEVWTIGNTKAFEFLDQLEAEGRMYHRREVELKSGLKVWMYQTDGFCSIPSATLATIIEDQWKW